MNRRLTHHPKSRAIHVFVGLVLAGLTLRSSPALATCWVPNLHQETDPTSGANPQTSKVITLKWDAYDPNCDNEPGFGTFVHHRVEVKPTCPAAETWSAGDGVKVFEIYNGFATMIQHPVWIAESGQCYAIFPCDDSTPAVCLGPSELDEYELDSEALTLAEVWVAVEVEHTAPERDYRVAGTDDAVEPSGGPEALRGLSAWGGDQGDALNLFAWIYDSTAEVHRVYARFHSSTGWDEFNTSTFDDEIELLVDASDAGTTGDFTEVGYPWAIPVVYNTGGDEAILMALQLGTDDIDDRGRHGLMLSEDEDASEMLLECADTGGCDDSECGYGDLCDYADDSGDGNDDVMVLDPDADEQGIDSYAHGRFVRSWPSNAPVDLCSETLHMVFTGMDGDTDTEISGYSGPYGDIFVWKYTSPSGTCSRATVMDPDNWAVVGTGGDPEPLVANGHDPAVLPTKGNNGQGFVRVYVNEWPWGTSRDWFVVYSDDDGVSELSQSSPSFYFDDGTGEPDTSHPITQWCLADMAGVAWLNGSNPPYEGLFAVLPGVYDEDRCDSFGSPASGSTPKDDGEKGLVFFELFN